jgi:hypothetical protein
MLMFDLKMIKLSRLFHFMQSGVKKYSSDKKVGIAKSGENEYHYKKTGAINLTGDGEETK